MDKVIVNDVNQYIIDSIVNLRRVNKQICHAILTVDGCSVVITIVDQIRPAKPEVSKPKKKPVKKKK